MDDFWVSYSNRKKCMLQSYYSLCNIEDVKKEILSQFSEYGSYRHRAYDRRISDRCMLRFLIRK